MKLNEVFDTSYGIKYNKFSKNADGTMTIHASFITDNELTYNIIGRKTSPTNNDDRDDKYTGGIWEFHFSKGNLTGINVFHKNIKVTGDGDAFKVMSTVTKFVKSIIKKYEPEIIEIISSAQETSRNKLYKRIITKNISNIGYSMQNTGVNGKQHIITLIK